MRLFCERATIGKLKTIVFCPVPVSTQVAGFLEEFENIALTTSAPSIPSELGFYTPQLWSLNYSPLLVFKQTMRLKCNGCSSTVDDDIIINLAQGIPGLEILPLGGQPCRVPQWCYIQGTRRARLALPPNFQSPRSFSSTQFSRNDK